MCVYRTAFVFKPIKCFCGLQFKLYYVLKYFLLWNGWIILRRLNIIKDFVTLFPFLTLHVVSLLLWEKIYSLSFFLKLLQYSDQAYSSGLFFFGSPHPSLDCKSHIGKKYLQQILDKFYQTFCLWYIFSVSWSWLIWKRSL